MCYQIIFLNGFSSNIDSHYKIGNLNKKNEPIHCRDVVWAHLKCLLKSSDTMVNFKSYETNWSDADSPPFVNV